MAQNRTDFHLPDEILSVIPTDPYDQLDLARKITSIAIASRVSKLESEAGRMREKMSEKDQTIDDLQQRVSDLDQMIRDSEARMRIALEENANLMKERNMLALTSKKLGKDLSKLETFKRQLMQSLNDDNSYPAESVDIATCDQSIARVSSWKDDTSISRRGSDLVGVLAERGESIQDEPGGYSGNKESITPYVTPRLTPATTPTASTGYSPRGFSNAGSSPKIWSGSASPTKSRFEGLSSVSSWNTPSSSQQSSSSNSPTGRSLSGSAPRMDGKEFFRQARSRLSYEQFGAFLANIKELNAHRQSHEETLEKAEEILGTDNRDLYISFQRLLNRNIP